jgi:Tol biopolymer transport system component
LDSDQPPLYSPNGARIVFASKQAVSGAVNGTASSSYNLFVMNANGSGLLALTQNTSAGLDSLGAAWAPDSSKIYFYSLQNLATVSGGSWNQAANANNNIWSINPDGTGLTALTTQNGAGLDSTEPNPSSDNLTIVFTSKMLISGVGANSTNIWAMHKDGTSQAYLTDATVAGYDSKNPVFSPDGSTIAYASEQDGAPCFNIWTMKSNGSNQANLTGQNTAGLDSINPSWEPDSLMIAFQSKMKISGSTPNSWNIWAMTSTGGSQLALTQNTNAGLDSVLFPNNAVWYQQ